MIKRSFGKKELIFDSAKGQIESLIIAGSEIICDKTPVFKISFRDKNGEQTVIDANNANFVKKSQNGAVYSCFLGKIEIELNISGEEDIVWGLSVKNNTDLLIEWIDYPRINLPKLKKNGGVGEVLFPYNEGALIDDMDVREKSWFPHDEPVYPSKGSYPMFPYMVQSQFIAYLKEGSGLYIGAHDEGRGPKGIDFYPEKNGVGMKIRAFCGTDFSESFKLPYPIVFKDFTGDWHDAADIYRDWFETHLPQGLKKISESADILPEWYSDSPLIVGYPVRGRHDVDDMTPNALFPYENALPIIREFAEKTRSRVMALLMHWEGTAPWAPPYVWPPYGGIESFESFAKALHDDGNLLGVYCSGFGYTIKSNLVDYDKSSEIEENGLMDAMCAGPDNKVAISRICTAQRSGYDMCVGSDKAKQVLDRAYRPLLESCVDYAQILDQNHGGSQYFCYSRDHGHPPAPGQWMTDEMKKLLDGWNDIAGERLLGCESAAAEAFIKNLRFSDNRFELNWRIGVPVPLYSYIYHEYLRNFMGNQCSNGLTNLEDSLRYRLAYSFAAGDSMTIVISPKGDPIPSWSVKDFTHLPDKELALEFAGNMSDFYRKYAGAYLYSGRMIKPEKYVSRQMVFHADDNIREITCLCVVSTAWTLGNRRAQIFINHTNEPQEFIFKGESHLLEPLKAKMIDL
ncbi:MAG: hypothetical protein E7334_07440 [Clostridiales bacterium]|nr:hypothetical protein [Clostridiales bacterium]